MGAPAFAHGRRVSSPQDLRSRRIAPRARIAAPGSACRAAPFPPFSFLPPPLHPLPRRDARLRLRRAWPLPARPSVGHFKERSSPPGRSREAGHRPTPLNYYTWRGLPCPAGVLARTAGATAFRCAASLRGPDRSWQITQAATSCVPTRHRPLHAHPVHDPCSREGDGPSIAQAGAAWMQLRNDFRERRRAYPNHWRRRKRFQSLSRGPAEAEKSPVANDAAEIHPREKRRLSSPSAEPVLGLPAARPGAHEVGNDGFIFSLRPIADVAANGLRRTCQVRRRCFRGGRYLSVPLQVELRLASSCGTGEASAGNNIVQSNMRPRLQAVLLPNCNESKQFSRETFAQLCACPDCAKLGSGWGAVWSLP